MPRVILVTGASSGIGAGCALRLAEAGHRVIGVSRSGTTPPFAAGTAIPPLLSTRVLDIRDPLAIEQTVCQVVKEFGRLDAVVNAAGIAIAGPLEDLPVDSVRAQLDTNLFGAVYLLRSSIPFLRRFAPAQFVHISSIAAHVALPYQSLYTASHFGMSGLLQSLRYELAPHGVRVTLVEPGSVQTALTANRQTTIAGPDYLKGAKSALEINDADERRGIQADRVARVVEEILLSYSPPVRRSVGHWHERLMIPLKRVLPARIFEGIIQSHYKV